MWSNRAVTRRHHLIRLANFQATVLFQRLTQLDLITQGEGRNLKTPLDLVTLTPKVRRCSDDGRLH